MKTPRRKPRKKAAPPEVTKTTSTNDAGEVERQVMKLKQGRAEMTITTTWDRERGIERREVVNRRGGRTNRIVLEIDIATGKLLPDKDMATGNKALASELQNVILAYSAHALKRASEDAT